MIHSLVFALLCLLFGGCKTARPTSAGVIPLSTAPAQITPGALMTPFLCIVQPQTLFCQTTADTVLRRGQKETRFPRDTYFTWTNPQGSGNAQVWYGCTGTNSCDGSMIFSSQTVKVTPGAGVITVAGKEGVIPFGSLGIASVTVENNQFTSITNRWTGANAPPILRPGAHMAISCVDDSCTVSYAP